MVVTRSLSASETMEILFNGYRASDFQDESSGDLFLNNVNGLTHY